MIIGSGWKGENMWLDDELTGQGLNIKLTWTKRRMQLNCSRPCGRTKELKTYYGITWTILKELRKASLVMFNPCKAEALPRDMFLKQSRPFKTFRFYHFLQAAFLQTGTGRKTNMQYYASFEEASCIHKLQSWFETIQGLFQEQYPPGIKRGNGGSNICRLLSP